MFREATGVMMSVGLFCLAIVLPGPAGAEITHTVTFDLSQVSIENGEGFDVIRVEGCRFELDPGRPMLPVKTLHLSIPAGMRAAGLEVRSLDQIELGEEFFLCPAQPPVRLGSETIPEFVGPDTEVYGSADPYPGRAAELVNTGSMGGYAVVGVHVYPLEYVPDGGKVLLNQRIDIALKLVPSEEPPRVIAGRRETGERAVADRVRALVANPERVAAHIGPRNKGTREMSVEYAVVTIENLADEFQSLADWKTKKGIPAQVFTMAWIESTYPAVDSVEAVREFIKDYEANHGLVYVLLGGDVYKTPARTLWDNLGNDGIRGDLYFSDTDGSWNADGDDRWGEHPEDNVDMYGDVYVGRASIQNANIATNFIRQVLTYEGSQAGDPLPTDFQEDMLFLAEILWDSPDPYTDGGVAKDMIDNSYVPAQFDPIIKLYERDGNLDRDSAVDALNAGPGITNHVGHANSTLLSVGPGGLGNYAMDGLTNGTRKGIFYSIGCYAAAFDHDNVAEHYVNNPSGGGVAFVGNNRYGWACPGYPGECVSDLYDRQFFRALFVSNLYRLGIAHADAKDYYVPDAKTDRYMRYALYELNVLGDPEMPVWTETPSAVAVSHPAVIATGPSSFTAQVSTAKAPVEGALVCLMMGSEIYEVAYTNGSGEVTFGIDPQSSGDMSVTVTKHNVLPYEGEVTVGEDTQSPTATVLDPNGGEEIVGGASTPYSIRWDADDNIGVSTTYVLLSVDGGASYSDTLASGALTSPWAWYADDMEEGICRIKVVCVDEALNEGSDESDSDFQIVSVTGVESYEGTPGQLVLRQNCPNPFNPATEIEFGLPSAQRILLEVFSVEGRRVATLAEGMYANGYHRVVWDGADARGGAASTGVYFYRLVTEERTLTRKMLLLK